MKSIKRIAAMVLALAILVIGASSVAFAESDYFKTTAELYLRMGPGTEYAPIICMDKGQKMTYIDHSYGEDGRDWFEVKTTSGIRGWCCSDYLTYVSGQTGSKVTIKGGAKDANAKSVMSLMSAAIKCGTELEIVCDGEMEQEALAMLVKMVESGLGDL